MIDFIIFSVLVALAAVLGKLLGKEVTKKGFVQQFINGRPMFQSQIHLDRSTMWRGSQVRKLHVKDESVSVPGSIMPFTGRVTPRAMLSFAHRNKLTGVLVTEAYLRRIS